MKHAEWTITRQTWLAMTIAVLMMWGLIILAAFGAYHLFEEDLEPVQLAGLQLIAHDVQERVECEFDKPITIVVSVFRWYESHEELNFDYKTLIQQGNEGLAEEVWGWSNCEFQPDNDIAICDVYAVVPEFVHADMNMDTIGHEVLHGACGDFHN